MKNLINEPKKEFELILVDYPAGIEQGFREHYVAGADEALCSYPGLSSVRDSR